MNWESLRAFRCKFGISQMASLWNILCKSDALFFSRNWWYRITMKVSSSNSVGPWPLTWCSAMKRLLVKMRICMCVGRWGKASTLKAISKKERRTNHRKQKQGTFLQLSPASPSCPAPAAPFSTVHSLHRAKFHPRFSALLSFCLTAFPLVHHKTWNSLCYWNL